MGKKFLAITLLVDSVQGVREKSSFEAEKHAALLKSFRLEITNFLKKNYE